MRFWEGWCGWGAIPPVVARIFSGDSTSPLTREARTWCGARDSAGLGGLVRIGNNPSGSRPILLGDSTSPLTREARIWCEAKALLLYQNDNERIYHTKKYINYAESGINRNPFLPPLEKGEVARLIIFFGLLYSIQIVLPLQF